MDLSANEDEVEGDQGSDDGIEIKTKEEKDGEAEAIALPVPAVFTISFGAPLTAGDYRLGIVFRDERVFEALARMPGRELWQLVRDAVHNGAPLDL